MRYGLDRRTLLLILVVATMACDDHTVLTGPDAEVAARQVQARVAADANTRADERTPVIFIDGVRRHGAPEDIVRLIEPKDIHRLEVIKSCAAASLLGADAKHGLIVIYTKAYEGDSLEFDVQYPALGEACRRDFQRERAEALAERKGDNWPPALEPIAR